MSIEYGSGPFGHTVIITQCNYMMSDLTVCFLYWSEAKIAILSCGSHLIAAWKIKQLNK